MCSKTAIKRLFKQLIVLLIGAFAGVIVVQVQKTSSIATMKLYYLVVSKSLPFMFNKFRFYLLFAFALSLAATPGIAQDKFEQATSYDKASHLHTARIQLLVGPSLQFPAFANKDSRESVSPKVSYFLGAGLQVPVSGKWNAAVQLIYDARRFSSTAGGAGYPYSVFSHLNTNYLTLNINPQFALGSSGRVVVGTGGYFSKLLNATLSQTATGSPVPASVRGSVADEFKNHDAGLIFTAGYKIYLRGVDLIMFQLSANIGLTNIRATDTPGRLPVSRNNSVMLTVIQFL